MKKRNLTGVWIGLAASLAAVSAFIRIPTQPVPFTMQVFVIFLIPIIFGPKIAFYGTLLYISIGLIGIPVFSSGGGPGYVLMPTFGYLLSYLVSSYVVGVICEKVGGFKRYLLAGTSFLLITYSMGAAWLYLSINYFQHKEMSLTTAIAVGVIPYILLDVLKISGAVAISPALRKLFFAVRETTGDMKAVKN